MTMTLNRMAFQRLVDENIAWLTKQPHTLERQHVIDIVKASVDLYYPSDEKSWKMFHVVLAKLVNAIPHGVLATAEPLKDAIALLDKSALASRVRRGD